MRLDDQAYSMLTRGIVQFYEYIRLPLVFCKIPKHTTSQLASFCRKDFPASLLWNKYNDKRLSNNRKIMFVTAEFFHYGFMHLSMLRPRVGVYPGGFDMEQLFNKVCKTKLCT